MNTNFFKTHIPTLKIYTFEKIESTNTFAKTLSDDFALVIANLQTGGRGRLGRDFSSPPATGLYMSLLVKVKDLYQNIPLITTAAAVGLHKAITTATGIKTSIKWVNDIYKGDKKVSGILCESIDNERAVIGIGINLFPNKLPPVATSLFDTEAEFDKEEFILKVIKNITSILNKLPDNSFIEYYKLHSSVLGKEVKCILPDQTFMAKVIDINPQGALVVENETGIKTLSTGEISIRLTD